MLPESLPVWERNLKERFIFSILNFTLNLINKSKINTFKWDYLVLDCLTLNWISYDFEIGTLGPVLRLMGFSHLYWHVTNKYGNLLKIDGMWDSQIKPLLQPL